MIENVSAILPCYNEGKTITPIIDEIKKSKYVKEIIVVDDSSDDFTRNLLQKISGIKLITHPRNRGKSQAMKTGLSHATSEIVVFVDGDLRNFKTSHFDKLVKPILKSNFDIVLGDLEREFFIFRNIGYGTAYTGERAIRRKILIENMDLFKAKGYLIEAQMNKRFFQKYKVTKVLLNQVGQTYKIAKVGVKGFLHDLKIIKSIAQFLGMKEQFYQLRFVLKLKYYSN